jgi:hypothetical protein
MANVKQLERELRQRTEERDALRAENVALFAASSQRRALRLGATQRCAAAWAASGTRLRRRKASAC